MQTTKNWSLALLALLAASRAAEAQSIAINTNPLIGTVATGPRSPGVTGYDTRYFKAGAGAAYRNCVQSLAYPPPRTGSGPYVLALPLSMAENACLSSVAASYAGNLCITPARAECRSMDYYASWCGRREYTARNADANWLCHAELLSALQSLPAGSLRTLAIPSEMSTASGTEHHYLERTQGYFSEPPVSAYFEFDSYSPSSLRPLPSSDSVSVPPTPGSLVPGSGPGIGTPVVVFSVINPMLGWNTNGAAVASCEEYAYEKYHDLSVFYAQAKAQLRRPRETITALTQGNFVSLTPAGTATWNMHDKSGAIMSNPFPAPLRYPMTETWTWKTGKNAYYDISRLMAPPSVYTLPTYTHSMQWHFDMNRRTQLAGYLDVELEELQAKQAEIIPIYEEWSNNESTANAYANWAAGCQRLPGASICNHYPGPDAAARATARARADQLRPVLDAAMEYGRLHGCVPSAATTLTACDWAPSLLAHEVLDRLPGWHATALKKCKTELGTTSVDNTALYAALQGFLAPPLPTVWQGVQLAEFTNVGWVSGGAQGTPRVYTSGTAMLERYFTDKAAFLLRLYQRLSAGGGTRGVLNRTGKYEKTMGRDGFGVSFSALSQAATDPWGESTICDSHSEYSSTTHVDANVMAKFDLVDSAIDLENALPHSVTELADYYNDCQIKSAGCPQTPGGALPLTHTLAVGGNAVWIPGEMIDLTATVAYQAGFSARVTLFDAPFSSPPFTASLRAGVSFAAGGRGSISVGFLQRFDGPTTCTPGVTRLSASAGPYANAGGWVAAGVGIGVAIVKIEAGIRGTLNVIDFALTGTGEHLIRRYEGNPDPEISDNMSLNLNAEFLSGQISLFLDVTIVIVSITIVEIVLARFTGPSISWRILSTDGVTGARLCAITVIEAFGNGLQRKAPHGCVIGGLVN